MSSSPLARGVSARVQQALADRGITELFPIQEQVVPGAIEGRDVLAQSPTGSGKTLAFGIAMVERLTGGQGREGRRTTRGLVLVPTRELAVQVTGELREIGSACSLTVAAVFGGATIGPQARQAARADILVATPGRLEDLICQGLVSLGSVEVLVLDEADRMLDMGFAPQVEKLLRRVPAQRQTMLFSATLDGAVGDLASRYARDPLVVTVRPTLQRVDAIAHEFRHAVHEEKLERLLDVLHEIDGQAVVFVRTKRGADRLAKRLRRESVRAGAMHGGMTQSARLRELASFSEGRTDTLVATDVFARGIDVDDIALVVNFDPPADSDAYTHRTGRTGRAGRTGTAVTLVIDDQRADVQTIVDELALGRQYDAAGLTFERPKPAQRGRDGAGGTPRRRRRRGAGGTGTGGGGGSTSSSTKPSSGPPPSRRVPAGTR